MTLTLADCRISGSVEATLSLYTEKIIKLPPFSRLPSPVASHPDMLVFVYGKQIFTWEEYAGEAPEVFERIESLGFKIKYIQEKASAEYPADVRLNCALVGRTLIANTRAVSRTLAELAKNEELTVAHTNQGYAKCSTAIVSENAVITADPSVLTAAKSAGLDVLKISEGHVRLDGYGTGFIGGASGVVGKSVLFCGDLSLHPDGERIEDFCRAHGKRAVSLSDEPMYDYGTIMLLKGEDI